MVTIGCGFGGPMAQSADIAIEVAADISFMWMSSSIDMLVAKSGAYSALINPHKRTW